MTTSDVNLVVGDGAVESLHGTVTALSGGVPALGLVNDWHDLAPAVSGEQILSTQLVEIACLDRKLEGMTKLDIDLVGIIIKGHRVCLVLVVEGLEEGATELTNFVELGVNVAED